MRRGILSLIATALAIPVLVGVLRQSYPLETAAVRLGVLALAVVLIDRLIAPLVLVVMAIVSPRDGGEREVSAPS